MPFLWSEKCQEAFNNVKMLLAPAVLLAPNFKHPFSVAVAASESVAHLGHCIPAVFSKTAWVLFFPFNIDISLHLDIYLTSFVVVVISFSKEHFLFLYSLISFPNKL